MATEEGGIRASANLAAQGIKFGRDFFRGVIIGTPIYAVITG